MTLIDVRCPRCGQHAKVPATAIAWCNAPQHRTPITMTTADDDKAPQ
jgi:hypothetical protein